MLTKHSIPPYFLVSPKIYFFSITIFEMTLPFTLSNPLLLWLVLLPLLKPPSPSSHLRLPVAHSLLAPGVSVLTPLVLVRSCPLVGQGLPAEAIMPVGLGVGRDATHPSGWAYPSYDGKWSHALHPYSATHTSANTYLVKSLCLSV